MAAASVPAQAKINLFLHVTGRDASGYHTLETLFCRIALADSVTVRLTPTSRSLNCEGPELPPGGLGSVAENLAWRAAVAYVATARWPSGFEIELEKHIPVRAGLGGGSADAGGVLRALNALNPRPLSHDVLQRIACALGADVPFLTQDAAALALAWSRGDEWRGLAPLPERICLLAIPAVGVATRDAYAWIDQKRGWSDREVARAPVHGSVAIDSWDDAQRLAHNDFESVVFPRHPEIAAAWRFLEERARTADASAFARLSGSGAAVFAVAASLPEPTTDRPLPSVRTMVTRTATRVESVQRLD